MEFNNSIRVITLAIIQTQENFLFDSIQDPYTKVNFLRPIGGGIEFGESSQDAMIREVKEEIDGTVNTIKLLGTFENIFTFDNKPKHEIVYLYDVTLLEQDLYNKKEITVTETWSSRIARWVKKQDLHRHIVYPPQILGFIS